MKSVSVLAIILAFLSACSSSSSKVPVYANDMCGCFETVQKKIDAEGLAVLEKVVNSETPQQTLQKEMAALKPEKTMALAEVFASVGNKESDVFKCLEGFDKRHNDSKSTSRKDLALEIAMKMKENKSCLLGAVVMYMGAKSIK
jgi:predicted transcriptional regulator with HTH domain